MSISANEFRTFLRGSEGQNILLEELRFLLFRDPVTTEVEDTITEHIPTAEAVADHLIDSMLLGEYADFPADEDDLSMQFARGFIRSFEIALRPLSAADQNNVQKKATHEAAHQILRVLILHLVKHFANQPLPAAPA